MKHKISIILIFLLFMNESKFYRAWPDQFQIAPHSRNLNTNAVYGRTSAGAQSDSADACTIL
jgi:hypothetical protein